MPELNLGLLLFIPYRALESAVLAELARHGHHLSIAQARVLQRIGPDGTRPFELAEASQLTKQTLGSILDQLQKAGYVARTPDPTDGRGRIVTLTDRGQELVAISLPVVEEMERAWADHLGPERTRQLREVLVDLREITDPYLGSTG